MNKQAAFAKLDSWLEQDRFDDLRRSLELNHREERIALATQHLEDVEKLERLIRAKRYGEAVE